jgi:diguanylate cyclase (GGDEF)-like protein
VYDEAVPVLGRAVQVAYPVGGMVLLAMIVRSLRGGGARGAAFRWMTGSLLALPIGGVASVIAGTSGSDLPVEPVAQRGLDTIMLMAVALLGLAALHPGSRRIGTAAPARPGGSMLVLPAVAALTAPAVLAAQLLAGQVTDGPAVVVGCTTLLLLVLLRMAQMLRQVERQAAQVRGLSRRDELTGLPNRRAWDDELPRALEHARRDGAKVSIALLDLDQVTDAYGHPAGDRLLKEASAAWHGALRQVDTLARYGGTAFIVLLPSAGTRQAVAVLERTLAATPQGRTFSAGVATWDGSETSDELIARAARARCAAGRNRICADAQELTPVIS